MAAGDKNEEIALRAHDIVASMERQRCPDFDALATLGLAVRLALHLRGAPPLDWELLRRVAVHILNFTPAEVKPVIELLAEAEFVLIDSEGRTIKTVIPQVPYFDDLYVGLGQVGMSAPLREAEQLAIHIVARLGQSPMLREHACVDAERKLAERVVDIGIQAGFVVQRRARGRDVLLSPSNYAEDSQAYADLLVSTGVNRVGKIVGLLRRFQGWPLSIIESTRELGYERLDPDDLGIIRRLAGDGFLGPPAIRTTHAGINHFIFGPPPPQNRLPRQKKSVYERAMALVAAVRQGQLLPARYAIKSPVALLTALRDRGYISANTEAWEQYRQIAEMRVARLVPQSSGWARLELITDAQENIEAVNMAINLLHGAEISPSIDEQAVLALHEGHEYVEALIGRKLLVEQEVVTLSEEAQLELDSLLLRGF